MTTRRRHLITWGAVTVAAAIFVPLFVTHGLGAFDFFWWMSANAAFVITLSAVLDPGWRKTVREDLGAGLIKKAALGLFSAAVLYGVFFVGNILSRMILPVAGQGIENVYAFKDGADTLRVALAIGVLIGPAEELFWRGFVQRRLSDAHGPLEGCLLATAVYAGIHIGSMNPMLVLAAGVCGLFWGLLWARYRSITLNVVSHVAWDLTVFLILPFE